MRSQDKLPIATVPDHLLDDLVSALHRRMGVKVSTLPVHDIALLRAILDGQQEILRRLDQLTARLPTPHVQPTISNTDRTRLQILLPLIGGRIGDACFTVGSLRAAVVLAKDEALASALDACSTKSLGRLLARAAGQNIDGWSVQRIGARIWKCQKM